MEPRFVLIRQGYVIFDKKENNLKKYKSASEASTECEKLNKWWESVLREKASTEQYDMYQHVDLLRNKPV